MHLIRQPNDCGYCVTFRSEGSLKQLLTVGSQVRCHLKRMANKEWNVWNGERGIGNGELGMAK